MKISWSVIIPYSRWKIKNGQIEREGALPSPPCLGVARESGEDFPLWSRPHATCDARGALTEVSDSSRRRRSRRRIGMGASCCVTRSLPTPTSGCRGFESEHATNKKPRTLTGTGLFCLGVSGRSRTHRDSTSVFALSKNNNIDISMFSFFRFCKKWHF